MQDLKLVCKDRSLEGHFDSFFIEHLHGLFRLWCGQRRRLDMTYIWCTNSQEIYGTDISSYSGNSNSDYSFSLKNHKLLAGQGLCANKPRRL